MKKTNTNQSTAQSSTTSNLSRGQASIYRTREPIISLGEISTIDKRKRNTGEVKLSNTFGDVMHFDIGYSCKQGLGGVKYSLMFVDRVTRHGLIYPLQNLITDLIKVAKQLVVDIGFALKKIVANFDMKLIGGAFKDFFTEKGTMVKGAPPRHQHQNGLVERH
eukprot:8778697-Ditylum_brightwellii.AAC.1